MAKYYFLLLQALVILSREILNISNGWWVALHNNTDRTVTNYICHCCLFMCTYLVNYYLITPQLLNKRYGRYFRSVMVLLAVAALVLFTEDYLFYEGTFPYRLHVFYAGFNVSFYFLTSTAFSLISEWNKANIRKSDLLKEKNKAELQLLKSQVNPHFLFNILNSIYALSLKRSGKTTSSLEKLNSTMQYMNDSAGKDLIPLKEEINYLKDIIELQKLRMRYPDNLSFSVEAVNTSVPIPPLLLLPLVENCFKHGNISGKSARIHLMLKQTEKEIGFHSENELKPEKAGGIGLENLRKRLEALYPAVHTFQVTAIGNKFIAELKFPLSK